MLLLPMEYTFLQSIRWKLKMEFYVEGMSLLQIIFMGKVK